ncbi:hypothetical protein L1987_53499 [Smallanthus sonchifolius]|uniref:Uncharacterized protein n=1 Tax=Smallanthus sonchifolius TaxID=185202 RepID=A0ACB9EW60_9ASTR|nr:hypothetical protein L1987_53499 [Smallanthus sonchifolius]
MKLGFLRIQPKAKIDEPYLLLKAIDLGEEEVVVDGEKNPKLECLLGWGKPFTIFSVIVSDSLLGGIRRPLPIMSSDPSCTVYIGNLDERVSDRVLYDILIQAGRVVDLHIPQDKETDKPKGFAFAEYETEEIADYAVRLFTGLVTLYNRTLRFGISGQEKTTPNFPASSNSPFKSRHHEDAATNPFSRYANVSRRVNRSHVNHNIHDHRRGFGTT